MKVLSYNISWCKQEKIDWILSHEGYDVYVIPECGDANHIEIPEGYELHWMGQYDYKGIGVIYRKDSGCNIASWYDPTLNYALPIIKDDYLVLAVWPTVRKEVKTDSYVGLLLDILNTYQPYIEKYKTVIIGDYNIISNPEKKLYGRKQGEIYDWMATHGLKSAYHSTTGEEYGKETVPTFYNRFRESEPFFLDYAYTNAPVRNYKTYSWDESNRMSDHVPIEVEIK